MGAAAFIAMVNDEPSLIIADYHEFHGKPWFEGSIILSLFQMIYRSSCARTK
jgi:hypothetical protein